MGACRHASTGSARSRAIRPEPNDGPVVEQAEVGFVGHSPGMLVTGRACDWQCADFHEASVEKHLSIAGHDPVTDFGSRGRQVAFAEIPRSVARRFLNADVEPRTSRRTTRPWRGSMAYRRHAISGRAGGLFGVSRQARSGTTWPKSFVSCLDAFLH